jgi:C-terminal processing protease CtpA/Prc
MLAARRKRYLKPLGITLLAILLITGAVLVREYLLLRRLADSFALPKSSSRAGGITDEEKPAEQAVRTAPLVQQVKRSATGNRVDARVSFKAFKRLVETNPRQAHTWGQIGWKVLGDVPALCLRSVSPGTVFTTLGVQSGDCITHLDGETVNQPLRNLGIWVTLGSRKQLTVDTLREGRRITYNLTSN